jgi:hypothetical protein
MAEAGIVKREKDASTNYFKNLKLCSLTDPENPEIY